METWAVPALAVSVGLLVLVLLGDLIWRSRQSRALIARLEEMIAQSTGNPGLHVDFPVGFSESAHEHIESGFIELEPVVVPAHGTITVSTPIKCTFRPLTLEFWCLPRNREVKVNSFRIDGNEQFSGPLSTSFYRGPCDVCLDTAKAGGVIQVILQNENDTDVKVAARLLGRVLRAEVTP